MSSLLPQCIVDQLNSQARPRVYEKAEQSTYWYCIPESICVHSIQLTAIENAGGGYALSR